MKKQFLILATVTITFLFAACDSGTNTSIEVRDSTMHNGSTMHTDTMMMTDTVRNDTLIRDTTIRN